MRFEITSVHCGVIRPGPMDEIRRQILVLLSKALMIILGQADSWQVFHEVIRVVFCRAFNDTLEIY